MPLTNIQTSHLVIDEILNSYGLAIWFMRYKPSKRAKYCLLFRSFCDSSVTDTYYYLSYGRKLGKITDDWKKQQTIYKTPGE